MTTGCSVYYDQVWKLPTSQLITILIKKNLINVVIINNNKNNTAS